MTSNSRFVSGTEPEWWCALPDTAALTPAAAVLCGEGVVVARHRSGRAWIVARSKTHPFVVSEFEAASVAILAGHLLRRAVLEGMLRNAIDSGVVAPLMAATGGATVVIAEARRLRVIADAAGFHRVFVARCGGVPVLTGHADILRRLVDAPVDRAWVAAKLASPEMPSVVRESKSPFTGVDPVAAGHILAVDGHRIRISRWWHPPDPVRGLGHGAAELANALAHAVKRWSGAAASGGVSVQLSGGLDSTALTFLARETQPLLVTTAGSSPVDDDLVWARRVAAAVPEAQHQVVCADALPLFFTGLDEPIGAGMDEPCSFTAGAARQRHLATLLAEHKVEVHLNGQGGDEVVLAPLAWLPAWAPLGRPGLRCVRGHAALHSISTAALLTARARRPSYPVWLRGTARHLRRPTTNAVELVGWEATPLLPPWATQEAGQLVAGLLADADPRPAHPDAGVHAAVVRIRASAYRAKLYADAMGVAGVPTVMPFFDHAVVSACLAVRPEHRSDPWEPKPLLRRACRHVVPAELLQRRTKGYYNDDIYRGWRKNRDQVRALLADSKLEKLGLVDPGKLRAELAGFGATGLPPGFVTDLVALEVWLRDLTPARVGGRSCA